MESKSKSKKGKKEKKDKREKEAGAYPPRLLSSTSAVFVTWNMFLSPELSSVYYKKSSTLSSRADGCGPLEGGGECWRRRRRGWRRRGRCRRRR